MKKMLVLVLVLCGLLTGCAEKNADSANSASDGAEAKTTLTFIGNAAVKLIAKNGTVLYIDPAYSAGDYSDAADCVLVTHNHDDHKPCDKLVMKDDAGYFNWENMLVDGEYKTVDYNGITIEAVPAGGNANHPIGFGVGYVVTIDGVKVYHAGDTSKIDEMGDLTAYGIDYALYPIDGIYNMDATEATEAANLVAAKHNIPIHNMQDFFAKKIKSDSFVPEGRLIVEKGETIVIGE